MHNSTPPTPPSGEHTRAQVEATLEEKWSMAERLSQLAHAALVMESEGWTVEDATPEPGEGWSAGEVVGTGYADSGETIVYSLHLDTDAEHWRHSVEKIFTQRRRYVASPVGSAIPVDYANWWLRDRSRMRELADQKANETLKEFLDR